MSFGQTAKSIIASVAPLLGTAIGGPFGGLAGTMLAKALGTNDPKAQEAAIASADPDTLLKLKQADNDFKAQMESLQISEDKLVYDDIANARSRQIAVKDGTPAILAYAITIGFFGTLGFMLWNGKPAVGGDALLVMLGALGAAWTSIVSYFYGSSVGSAKKDTVLAAVATK